MKVWVLGDDRVGNTNQATALALALEQEFELIPLQYNCWGRLPNFALKWYPFHVKKMHMMNLLKTQVWPQIIITAGRRTAAVALYLKHRSMNRIKLVQIMQPELACDKFDLVILPWHDQIKTKSTNVLRFTGAFTRIAADQQYSKLEFYTNYPFLKKFIAVAVGGNNKNYQFTEQDAKLLTVLLNKSNQETGLPLFVSFSRRTPIAVKTIIKTHLPYSSIIYDPFGRHDQYNPYIGMLTSAEYVIATADSISMCSDVIAYGKPLYVFYPPNFYSPKHATFFEQLLKQEVIKMFNESTISLGKYTYQPINEVNVIADVIKKRFLN